ncbi:unnamed protein product [Effrenium voratum]|nr:unnamed protein product [Effrenium voratum]
MDPRRFRTLLAAALCAGGLCFSLPRRSIAAASIAASVAGPARWARALAPGAKEAALPAKLERFFGLVPVYAVTDPGGAPVLEKSPQGPIGRFFLDDAAASEALRRLKSDGEGKLEVRRLSLSEVFVPLILTGDPKELGGRFFLVPIASEAAAAARRLQVEEQTLLAEVPLFLCPALEVEREAEVRVPTFLQEKDLLEAMRRARVEDGEVVVTTLQRVAADLSQNSESAAGQLLAVSDLNEIGLGRWFFFAFILLGVCLFWKSAMFADPQSAAEMLFSLMNGDSIHDAFKEVRSVGGILLQVSLDGGLEGVTES